jgi:AraC-like DNA-binding protein
MFSIIEILTTICILILGFSSFFKKIEGNKERNRVLIFALCFISYAQLILMIHSFPFYKNILFFTYSDAVVFYLVMPCIYIYVMSLLQNRPIFSPINGINILPALPGFVYVVYFNTLSSEQQIITLSVKYCGVLQDNWLYSIGMATQLFYMIFIILKINKFLNKVGDCLTIESTKRLHQLSWIMYLQIIVGISVIILVTILQKVSIIHRVDMFMLLFIFCSVFFILYFQKSHNLTYIVVIPNQKRISTILKNKNQDAICNKIITGIEQNEFFKNPSASIVSFSKEIKIPVYKISLCIKEQYNMSFPEYINACRIDFAKRKLQEEKDSFIKLDFFALECGFGSRSSFYTEFKKQLGVTPIEYLKSLKE